MQTTLLYALTKICHICDECPHCGESISYDTDRLPTLHHCAKCLQPFDFKVEYMHLSADQ
jgi:hypothetical protein